MLPALLAAQPTHHVTSTIASSVCRISYCVMSPHILLHPSMVNRNPLHLQLVLWLSPADRTMPSWTLLMAAISCSRPILHLQPLKPLAAPRLLLL